MTQPQPAAEEIERILGQLRRLLAKHPKSVELHAHLASIYEQSGKQALAAPHLRFLWAADPNEEICTRLARALQLSGEFDAAFKIVEDGLKRRPDAPRLLKSKAMALWLLQRYEEARETFLALSCKDASPDYGRGMAGFLKLLITDAREGYDDYAFRPELRALDARFSGQYARWSGAESLAGKKLLLWGEQGIGDIIMFAGFAPWLMAQGAQLAMLVTPKLVPLFTRSFPGAEILPAFTFNDTAKGRYDYHIPMGDVMQIALPVYKPAEHPPYLKADTARARALRERYMEGGAKKLIGVSWHTTNEDVGFTRNISLEQMAPLFALPGIQWISLQYGNHDAEIAAVNRQFPGALIRDPSIDAFDDIDGLAAQACAMDEVITTSNAGAHLAGALGVPTTLLTSATPDWRWRIQGEKNFWYGSMVMERQERLLSWKPVIKRLRTRLMK